MNDDNLEKLKRVELDILKAFIEVCDKLNLKYYALFGTLLGAARHKGFIPWDDDIDVGMSRQDYEIFIKKGQTLLPNYYFIQSKETEPNYPHFFAKIRDSRTTFIETSVKKFNINHGVYIDIFPIDYYPTNKFKSTWIEFKKKLILLSKRLMLTLDKKSKRSFTIEFIFRIGGIFSKLIYPTRESCLNAWDSLSKNIKESNLLVVYAGPKGKSVVVPIEWYGEGIELDFENIKINCPSVYKSWLTNLYGDYMTLPSLDKRNPKHYTEIIDLENPWTNYF